MLSSIIEFFVKCLVIGGLLPPVAFSLYWAFVFPPDFLARTAALTQSASLVLELRQLFFFWLGLV